MNIQEKEKVQSIINAKVEKHQEKLRLHEDSKRILEIQREEMKQKVQEASDAAIAKKDKVIKHILGN